MRRDELREKISRKLAAEAMGIAGDGERLPDDLWQQKLPLADRILALLPPQPKLEWRGDELFNCGEAHMLGYIYNDRVGWWGARPSEHYIENPFTTEHEAKSAVEAAVRKALGMSHD